MRHPLNTIVSDNSGHEYVIPFQLPTEWNAWVDLDEEDERSWEEPEWAERIDGGRLVFGAWTIE